MRDVESGAAKLPGWRTQPFCVAKATVLALDSGWPGHLGRLSQTRQHMACASPLVDPRLARGDACPGCRSRLPGHGRATTPTRGVPRGAFVRLRILSSLGRATARSGPTPCTAARKPRPRRVSRASPRPQPATTRRCSPRWPACPTPTAGCSSGSSGRDAPKKTSPPNWGSPSRRSTSASDRFSSGCAARIGDGSDPGSEI